MPNSQRNSSFLFNACSYLFLFIDACPYYLLSKGFTAVGTVEQLRQFCATVGKKWNHGLKLIPALE